MRSSRKKTTNIRLIIILLMIAIAGIYLIRPFSRENDDLYVPKAPAEEPVFQHEGNLAFVNVTGDTLAAIKIEVAAENRRRMQGLMYRSSMPEEQGMLFVFDEEEPQSFWMKNTKISLDIMFVNRNREIVSIVKGTRPFSETPVPSEKPAIYVVEVIAGYTDKYAIREGDKILFELF
ncbi:MAG: DUF192 domain-containing protein [Cyclobacteriaceae bacterium]|nr:DUF192 domain-containing protein [Cyclobacteriaceae bacterium]